MGNIKYIFLLLILVSCHSKHEAEQIRLSENEGFAKQLDAHFSNDDSVFEMQLKELRDSGSYINDLKEGYWKEYSIDSSLKEKKISFKIGDRTSSLSMGKIPQMQFGKYVNGRKDGTWVMYRVNGRAFAPSFA